jgi:hypothetical protein
VSSFLSFIVATCTLCSLLSGNPYLFVPNVSQTSNLFFNSNVASFHTHIRAVVTTFRWPVSICGHLNAEAAKAGFADICELLVS